ncbi:MAG: CDP-glycerol glycerophosphotransferase family protein [Alistipes sp.]|nr:CDP-glycerol glycerophosphotransferase family protein [Alistipes sp.]
MNRVGSAIGWGLSGAIKTFGNLLSFVVRCFVDVKPGRVLCWAYNYKQYGCNPRYLTEYIIEHHPDMEVVWVFRKGVDTSCVDSRVRCVRFRSWDYFKMVASAEFLVTNSRTDPWRAYWHKRPEQKYLMLWHGGAALKQVERDVEDKLGYGYVRKAKHDSEVCDLMISGCRANTELIRRSFWYSGEVLEEGIPRNDMFFDKELHAAVRQRIFHDYNIEPDSHIVLYAPTFRRSGTIEPYRIDWQEIIPRLEQMFGGKKVTLFLRLHPNLLGKVDTSVLMNHPSVIDMTRYHDMQELLCISDMLITDYSSSMFDFAMLGRPCLLYATDVEEYDRGYYYDFRELPFPLARNVEQLKSIIEQFDTEKYKSDLDDFLQNRLGLKEHGVAAKSLAEWMNRHSIASPR